MDGGYDHIYRSSPCVWRRTPGALITWLATHEPTFVPRRVLDAGCGEGKNSIFYAKRGSTVKAVDVSAIAIHHARTTWRTEAAVEWECADVRTLDFPPEHFDLVIAYGLLHCFESRLAISQFVASLKAATEASGYHIVCAFNDRHQELEAHGDFRPTLLPHTDFLALYEGWEQIYASDADLTEKHPHNGLVHTHSLTRAIFRKPKPK